MAKPKDNLSIVRIEKAIITEIDFENQSFFARSEMSEQPSYRIPIMSPYIDSTTSSGLKVCPQVGTTCILAELSDGTRCILGFIPVDDTKGSLDAGFPSMVSGDMFIHGPEGNFIRVRSGGIVEIGASPICSSIFIPTRNILHQISENFILDTFAGSLEFKVNRAEDDGDGHQKCNLNINIKEFADDENEVVRIRSGSLDENVALSLTIKDSGNKENIKISIELKKDGNMNVKLEKDFAFSSKGKIEISADEDISVKGKKNLSSSANQTNTLKGSEAKVVGDSKVLIQSPNIEIKGGFVEISNSAQANPIRLTLELAAVLSAAAAAFSLPLNIPNIINPTIKI